MALVGGFEHSWDVLPRKGKYERYCLSTCTVLVRLHSWPLVVVRCVAAGVYLAFL